MNPRAREFSYVKNEKFFIEINSCTIFPSSRIHFCSRALVVSNRLNLKEKYLSKRKIIEKKKNLRKIKIKIKILKANPKLRRNLGLSDPTFGNATSQKSCFG
jgi:hypothetical protein